MTTFAKSIVALGVTSSVACGGSPPLAPSPEATVEDGGTGATGESGNTAQNGAAAAGSHSTPGARPPSASAGCGKAFSDTGAKTVALNVGGVSRTFLRAVPVAYSPEKAYRVVFALHGDGGNGANARAAFNLESVAQGEAIFVYPDGQNKTWNIDKTGAQNADIGFFDALLSNLESTLCIDRSKVFMTGISRGGYMTNHLGCQRGSKLRAIAPHSGGGPFAGTYDAKGKLVCPEAPPAALILHGNADTVVKPSEGDFSIAHWTRVDQCAATTKAISPSPCVEETNCGRTVAMCKIPGLGHAVWSNASRAIWDFFLRQSP